MITLQGLDPLNTIVYTTMIDKVKTDHFYCKELNYNIDLPIPNLFLVLLHTVYSKKNLLSTKGNK